MLNILWSWLTALSFGDWLGIFTSGGGFLLGAPATYSKFRSWQRRRRFSFLFDKRTIVIWIPSREVGRRFPVIAKEDQQAAERFRAVLTTNGYSTEIDYITTDGFFSLDHKKSNAIICGPKNSPHIADAFHAMPFYTFSHEGDLWYFEDRDSGNRIISPMDRTPPQDGDLAFFGKVLIPRMPQSLVVLICGIHALGSLGIASYLENTSNLDHLFTSVRRKKFCSIIRSRYSKERNDIIDADVFFAPRTFE